MVRRSTSPNTDLKMANDRRHLHYIRVRLIFALMRSARREESCGFAAKTSICGQHKGGKDIMGSTSRTRSPYSACSWRRKAGSWNDRRMRLDEKSLRQRMHPVTDSRSLSL